MYSLTINPDKSAVYTEMKDGVQTTVLLSSDVFMTIMNAQPTGTSRWEDLSVVLNSVINNYVGE